MREQGSLGSKVVNSTRVIRINRIKINDRVEVFDPGQTRVRSILYYFVRNGHSEAKLHVLGPSHCGDNRDE